MDLFAKFGTQIECQIGKCIHIPCGAQEKYTTPVIYSKGVESQNLFITKPKIEIQESFNQKRLCKVALIVFNELQGARIYAENV